LLLVLVAFFLPRQYRVERALVINAKPTPCSRRSAICAREKLGAWQERTPA